MLNLNSSTITTTLLLSESEPWHNLTCLWKNLLYTLTLLLSYNSFLYILNQKEFNRAQERLSHTPGCFFPTECKPSHLALFCLKSFYNYVFVSPQPIFNLVFSRYFDLSSSFTLILANLVRLTTETSWVKMKIPEISINENLSMTYSQHAQEINFLDWRKYISNY